MPEITYPNNIDLSPIKYIRSYITSPGFKKRLRNISDLKQRKSYQSSAIKHINDNVTIKQSDRKFTNKLKTMAAEVVHALSFRKIINPETLKSLNEKVIPTSYYPLYNTIYIDKNESTSKVSPSLGSTLAHEYGHKVNPSNDVINYRSNPTNAPQEYVDIHRRKKIDFKNNHHDAAYSETYSDLMGTRYNLFESGIFDSRLNQIFTKEHYQKYKQYLKKNNLHNRLMEQFSENDFILLMNEVAQNNLQQENKNLYAKAGKKLTLKT